ncbi:minor tail protein [Gordonia phage LonelyBoi]|nr:minor tail protein [Gordonia phage LonelyBoi]
MPTITFTVDGPSSNTGGTLTFRPRTSFADPETGDILTPEKSRRPVEYVCNTPATVELPDGPWEVGGLEHNRLFPIDVSADALLKDLIVFGLPTTAPVTTLSQAVTVWLDAHVNTEVTDSLIATAVATPGSEAKTALDAAYAPSEVPVRKDEAADPETESWAALHNFEALFRRPISAADPTFGIDNTGASDCTAAFQAMLYEAEANGKAVEVPRGDYVVTRLIMPTITCIGHGKGGFGATASQGTTMIRQAVGATGGMIRFTTNVADGLANIGPVTLGNMILRGNGSNATGKAIEFLAADGGLAGIQDTTILQKLLIRGFVGGGIVVPKGARPLHLKDINLLFNGAYGIDFQSPGGYLTQAVHFDNISGDGNLNGLIRIKDMDEAGSIIFTNIKSEKRINSGLAGSPAGQQSVIVFENCVDTPVSVQGLTHVSSVPSGAVHEPPGPAFVVRGTGSPKLEWSGVSVRVRPDDVAGTPAVLRDEVRGVTVDIDQTSGRYHAGRKLFTYDERSNGGADLLDVGEETFPRRSIASGGVGTSAGALRLTYFTARKTETVASVRVGTGSTAAAATPTLCRIGIYEVASNGDLTLVGSTANDTTLFAAANTRYTRALSTPFTKRRGRRYAYGVLVVTGAATPTFPGVASIHADEAAVEPRLSGSVASQTDLPSTVAAGTVAVSASQIYAVLTP